MTEIISAPQAAESAGVSRRRIMQGAAWAAPAIVIATAAPALAASTDAPAVAAIASGYKPNPGNSYQKIDVTVTRSGSSTASISLTKITVTFVKNGGQQASSAEVQTAGWIIDTANSTFPSVNGATGTLVMIPTAPATLSGGTTALTVSFNLNRFAGIDPIRIDGTSGSLPVTYQFTPVAA